MFLVFLLYVKVLLAEAYADLLEDKSKINDDPKSFRKELNRAVDAFEKSISHAAMIYGNAYALCSVLQGRKEKMLELYNISDSVVDTDI